jgi:hypothetical protein
MRDPDHVMDQVLVRYRQNWRDWLFSGADVQFSFPIGAPSAQAIARESDAVGQWMRTWRNWSQEHPGAMLRSVSRHTIIGAQEVFTHLEIPTVNALVALDQNIANQWRRANLRWPRIRALPGGASEERLRQWIQQIIELEDADFEILVKAAEWFAENPRSELTTRQVPVLGMGTKWLARNRRLVLACLNIAEGSHASEPGEDLEQSDLDPLGLKCLPIHIDVILADPADRLLIGGVRHLRAPMPEVAALPIHPEMVLIVENKEAAYVVPDRPRTVIIHSLGNHLNVLDDIIWLKDAHQLYWGDLDRTGFTLLSRARALLPGIVSVLMDPVTVEEHRVLAIRDETRADAPEPNLTGVESSALAALSTEHGSYLRLEQERLSPPYIIRRLSLAMEARHRRGRRLPAPRAGTPA